MADAGSAQGLCEYCKFVDIIHNYATAQPVRAGARGYQMLIVLSVTRRRFFKLPHEFVIVAVIVTRAPFGIEPMSQTTGGGHMWELRGLKPILFIGALASPGSAYCQSPGGTVGVVWVTTNIGVNQLVWTLYECTPPTCRNPPVFRSTQENVQLNTLYATCLDGRFVNTYIEEAQSK
jgi:hypothetical protein